MRKKYHVVDADGQEYNIEEQTIEEDVKDEDVPAESASLSDEELAALKRLAAVSDKLISLIETNDEDSDMDEEGFNDDETCECEEEEIINTDDEEIEEKKMAHDSKKSIGAIEREKTNVDDSLVDDISEAWAKRLGGIR